MTLKQYTIESMSYLTTGILDSGEEDASVEAAMCKVSYCVSLYISVKLPTYPSPKPTFWLKWEVSVNVSLGEG